MHRNNVTGSPLRNAAAILLGDELTEDVTETAVDQEIIFVTNPAPEIPVKRKRGRPSKEGAAMTSAERARRYREKKRPAQQSQRVEIWRYNVDQAQEAATKAGISIELMVNHALGAIREEEWNEMAERWVRYNARKAANARTEIADADA